MAVIVNKEEEGQGGVSEVQLPSTQQVAPQDFRNRFKIVKVETTEPLKRGRWTCFDFVDKPAAKEKSAPAAAECSDKAKTSATSAATGNVSAAATATVTSAPSGPKVVSSRPASSMARELATLHETATAATMAAGDEGNSASSGQPGRHVAAAVSAGQPEPARQAAAAPAGVVFSSAGGNYAAGGSVAAVSSAAGAGQQLQQQPQVSPPVATSLPQVMKKFVIYVPGIYLLYDSVRAESKYRYCT
jgi:hypothetical protein